MQPQAAFGQCSVTLVKDVFDGSAFGAAGRQALAHALKTEQHALHALQQRIMNVGCQPLALGHLRLHLAMATHGTAPARPHTAKQQAQQPAQ